MLKQLEQFKRILFGLELVPKGKWQLHLCLICRPFNEDGYDLRSLKAFNKAAVACSVGGSLPVIMSF